MHLFATAATANDVFNFCASGDSIYKDVLKKYFKKKEERNEFTNHIWLQLLSNEQGTVDAWNKKYFKYYFLAAVKNQVQSSSSCWHNHHRKTIEHNLDFQPESPEEDVYEFLEEEEAKEKKEERNKKINLVNEALQFYLQLDGNFLFEYTVFRMYYFENLSIRQIQKRLHNISTLPIHQAIQYATLLVKKYIAKYHPNNKQEFL